MSAPIAILTFTLLAGGMAVWALVGWRVTRGEPIVPETPHEEPRWAIAPIVVVAAFVGFQLFAQINYELKLLKSPGDNASVTVDSIQASTLVKVLLFAALILFLSDAGRRSVAEFGLQWKRSGRNALIGVQGFLASFPAVYLVVQLTQPLQSEERTHPYIQLGLHDPSFEVLFWIGLAVLIAAPLAEELVFRVVLQGWLRTKLPAAAAIAISSVLFAAVHGFPDSLALLPLAVILGYVFEKTHSYFAVVVLHALFNAQSLAALLLGGGVETG